MKTRHYLQRILALVAFAAIAGPATARTSNSVTITEVAELNKTTGMVWIRFSANIPGTKPSCVDSGWENYLAFDVTTTAGSRLLTIVWAAMLAGKRVDAGGTGACINVNGLSSGDVEQLHYIKVYAN